MTTKHEYRKQIINMIDQQINSYDAIYQAEGISNDLKNECTYGKLALQKILHFIETVYK